MFGQRGGCHRGGSLSRGGRGHPDNDASAVLEHGARGEAAEDGRRTVVYKDGSTYAARPALLVPIRGGPLTLFTATTRAYRLAAMTHSCESYDELKQAMLSLSEGNQAQGFWLVPWKCDAKNEEAIKQETKATIRCYPFEHNQSPPVGKKCFYSGEPATHMALFARAF